MFTIIILGVVVLVILAMLGFVPYVTALPFTLEIPLSQASGYWYNFTHLFWFLTPVWDVATWYLFIFLPVMLIAKLIFGHRVR